DAAGRGLRLIGYDRPGCGGSTPSPGYSVADCAGDVRAICAALGIDRLAMWGISGDPTSRVPGRPPVRRETVLPLDQPVRYYFRYASRGSHRPDGQGPGCTVS